MASGFGAERPAHSFGLRPELVKLDPVVNPLEAGPAGPGPSSAPTSMVTVGP